MSSNARMGSYSDGRAYGVAQSTGVGNGPQADADGRCTASTRSGKRCRGMAVTGTTVCRMHGGSAPQVQAAAERRAEVAEQLAARADWEATYGELGDAEDPGLIMQREIQWTAAHVKWLRDRVQETEAEALVWGVESEADKGATEFPGIDTTYSARIHGWVRLYGQERDRLFKMIETAARIGLDERLVRLQEIQTTIMFEIVNRALETFGVEARKPEASTVMASVVREVMAERQARGLPAA
ncbi:HGGxSTG domain-containing protein [Streptomyces sp. NPDC005438]|uniref:HGGxSTG domain-containing protein n=1 Tax=Streptomyces sp. NPDC005438 TaxID=3156880 RepID=UPI0033A5F0E5